MEQTVAQTILKNENMVGGFAMPDFKTYYTAIVIRTISHWHKNRKTYQCNIIESRN